MKKMNQLWVKVLQNVKVADSKHMRAGSLMFLPGSQISDKPLKDISHLMNEPQKFALIKLDKIRGNACVSRREIISSFKKEIKQK